MINTIEEIPEVIENIQLSSRYVKYLDYRKKWVSNNKDKINNYAKIHYLKKLNDLGEEYRNKINQKNKENRLKKKEKLLMETPEIVIKKGRPKKITNEIVQKKANGRPRKFNLDGTLI